MEAKVVVHVRLCGLGTCCFSLIILIRVLVFQVVVLAWDSHVGVYAQLEVISTKVVCDLWRHALAGINPSPISLQLKVDKGAANLEQCR